MKGVINTLPGLLLLFLQFAGWGQPFLKDVHEFARQDSLNPPPIHSILFIGSSSFTRWKGLAQAFPDKPVVNRAFGGSTLADQLYYAETVIFKYQPKQIVLYCGENDLAGSETANADTVFNRFKRLVKLISSRLPQVPILYVSMKPSPSRMKYLEAMQSANKMIEKYCQNKRLLDFLDVYHPMLQANGEFRNDIYVADQLHMNELGYAIWQPLINARLLK